MPVPVNVAFEAALVVDTGVVVAVRGFNLRTVMGPAALERTRPFLT
jgi:hypothetical protein